ncbi:MAG TPA: hypothetical protein VKW76_02390 [Candidatus Binatia bacterium]|nr:hypothetical protein [Candidatus Binatia bacterium]
MGRLFPVLCALGLALAGPARGGDLVDEVARADTEAEERVHTLLASTLAEDHEAAAAAVADLAAWDDARRDAGRPSTGLVDDARYLTAALAPTRDAQRAALEDLLATHPDPLIRHLADHQLAADDADAASRLLADDRHNRRASLLNDAVRPLGLFSPTAFLAALNPLVLAGSAVDSLATTAVNLWNYDQLSPREREALVRYRTELERTPETDDAPAIARAIRRLGGKRAAALCAATVEAGATALDAGDLDHARFYLRDASRLDECEGKAAKPLDRLSTALARRAAREEAGRWPVDDPPLPRGEEAEDYAALVVAVAAGDPGTLSAAANRFVTAHGDSSLAPGARYAVALARDLGGHHADAREALADLAHDHDSAIGRHAGALLASSEWSRLADLDAAERQHARDVARYVLFGGGLLDGRSALYGAVQLGTQGVQAAQTLGLANVLGIATRAWHAWWHDPASNQAIIDRGEQFLAREPQSPDAAAVHARLTDAYERAGNPARALLHYQALPDPDPKRVAQLENELGDSLLADAEKHGNDPAILRAIVRNLGDTKAAGTARQRLEKAGATGEVVVSREVLAATPWLAGPSGLDLDPALLDGDRRNGELADGGVTLADGAMRLALENTDGPGQHIDTRALDAAAYARARAAAEEALYTRLVTADHSSPDTGRFERYIPFFFQGQIDDSGGLYLYPGVKMRPYESEDGRLYE